MRFDGSRKGELHSVWSLHDCGFWLRVEDWKQDDRTHSQRGCCSSRTYKQQTTKQRPICQSGADPSQWQRYAPALHDELPAPVEPIESQIITVSKLPCIFSRSKIPQTLWWDWWQAGGGVEKRGIFLCLLAFALWQRAEKGLHHHYCSFRALCFPPICWSTMDCPIQTKAEHSNNLASRKRRTTVAPHYSQTHQPPQSPAKRRSRWEKCWRPYYHQAIRLLTMGWLIRVWLF